MDTYVRCRATIHDNNAGKCVGPLLVARKSLDNFRTMAVSPLSSTEVVPQTVGTGCEKRSASRSPKWGHRPHDIFHQESDGRSSGRRTTRCLYYPNSSSHVFCVMPVLLFCVCRVVFCYRSSMFWFSAKQLPATGVVQRYRLGYAEAANVHRLCCLPCAVCS